MSRCTLLFIIEDRLLREAIRHSLDLADEYQRLLPHVLTVSRSEIYAVGEATRIQQRTKLPRRLDDASSAATSAGAIQAVWSGGRWSTPGDCPPAPADSNGATAWQWAHYNAVMNAAGTAHLILWDLYVQDAEGWLAA